MHKKVVSTATAVFLAASFTGNASAATYEVKSGDSLWKIASSYNTTINQIKDLNQLKSDLIYPKQILQITPEETKKAQAKAPAQTRPEQPTQKQTTQSATYTIKSGDTLGKIAASNKVTVAQLYEWNNLKSDLIHPGQVLKVSNAKTVVSKEPAPKTETVKNNNSASKTGTYTVVSGDTLSKIALQYGMTVKELKSLNSLSSDLIRIGQVLKVNAKAQTEAKPAEKVETPKVTEDTSAIVKIAKSVMGTKYVWGGTTLSGFDCSGFIYYVFNQAGKKIARYGTDGYYDRSYYVNKPEPGDLVFFENTYRSGISHMGIYLGNNEFIHASDRGVEIANLNTPYNQSKFNGFKRFY
ncbi:LysM peptidoglycan-binding domain-containing protein [Bacillus sp. FJAT-49732]|uniref:LysM peptidoglycan-binding domain-containing protein n=1 Tax=Lederbergia citrisecunda TaxID=2833583 RepID=A0A942TRT2_9BACI|nr:peptidoglycan endopeptidase [Lederbergia citrisecunda]MBS4200669.1 LysM peptidoglycan-binding domain-containing protein [Lederbergia citrisecunda]